MSSTIRIKHNGVEIDSAEVKFSGVVSFNDLLTQGNTTINGANITTGVVSADYIDTENLACTKLYAKGNYNGWTTRMNGNWGDFGIFTPDASDNAYSYNTKCLFGIYNTAPNVNFYVYGHNFMGWDTDLNVLWAKGPWKFYGNMDFTYADVTNLESTFG